MCIKGKQLQFSTDCEPVGISCLVSLNYELSNQFVISQIACTGDDHPFYVLVFGLSDLFMTVCHHTLTLFHLIFSIS